MVKETRDKKEYGILKEDLSKRTKDLMVEIFKTIPLR